ncbi:MAG: hypothetical protein ACLUUJ_10410, partial [Acutalibacteraceae bacterium]
SVAQGKYRAAAGTKGRIKDYTPPGVCKQKKKNPFAFSRANANGFFQNMAPKTKKKRDFPQNTRKSLDSPKNLPYTIILHHHGYVCSGNLQIP